MNEFEVSSGIWFATEFNSIKKSKDQLRPIYEAFTNSWEALQEAKRNDGFINIDLYRTSELIEDSFDKIIVEDNGCGLNDVNYDRLKTLRKNTKGNLNKGTGRVQYLHFFNKTRIESVYEGDGVKRKRIVELSKSGEFLNKSAFIKILSNDITNEELKTKVVFFDLLDAKDCEFYEHLSIESIKEKVVMHYMVLFCQHRDALPQITIRLFVNGRELKSITIEQKDIPNLDKEENFEVNYSTVADREIITLSRSESFCLRSFKISQENLPQNSLRLNSKDEVLEKKMQLPVPKKQNIEGFRYLFFVSGDYLDKNDSDSRGIVHLCSEKDLKRAAKEDDLFNDECITIESLNNSTLRIVEKNYPVFNEKKQEKFLDIKELKEMFLLDDEAVNKVKDLIPFDASDEEILVKIYKDESKKSANIDAQIAETKKKVESLDPTADDYAESLKNAAEELTKQIPAQNKNELSKYVARRKIVLDVFQKILEEEEKRQSNGDAIDEDVLHNLIFQQHSQDTGNSDLWLINEDYIYFQGTSESRLDHLTYNGERIFKEDLVEEEEEYRKKMKGDAFARRTDVLLFPKEGKCIIIEFKAPDVNVSDYLSQIPKYAALINNLSKEKFKIHSFYGYLIGEQINDDDVFDNESRYQKSEFYDYLYQLDIPVHGKFGRSNGTLNMEIIKYSTILERAKVRNQIFIEKLTER